MQISVPNPIDDALISQLRSLYLAFKGVNFGQKIDFDLCRLKWVNPFLILPISAYINETKSNFIIENCPINSYLQSIGFPKGVDSVSEFQRYKTYIPIGVLSRNEKIEKREKLTSLFEEKIYDTLGNIPGTRSAVLYPISELITNIFEHSKKDFGFAFGQFYQKKSFLDICIVDCGRGLAASYKEDIGIDLTDSGAIGEAMRGKSVKKDKERGFGLWTSKDVVCNALKGGFILISGSSALISDEKGDRIVSLKDFYWQGVIISFRIPKPSGPVDYLKYIE